MTTIDSRKFVGHLTNSDAPDGRHRAFSAMTNGLQAEVAPLEVLSELGPQFEGTTGYTLSFSYDPANAIKRQIENGTAFDVVIATRKSIDDLIRQGEVLPDTCVDIGHSGLGVSVRKGAP